MEDTALKSKGLLRLSVNSWSGINLRQVGAVSIQRAALICLSQWDLVSSTSITNLQWFKHRPPPTPTLINFKNMHAHANTHAWTKTLPKLITILISFFEVDSLGGRRDPGEVSWPCRQDDVRCCKDWPPRAAPSCRAAQTAPQPPTLLPSDSPDHQQVHRMSITTI